MNKSRQEFEKFIIQHKNYGQNKHCLGYSDGEYHNGLIQALYEAWQAAAKSSYIAGSNDCHDAMMKSK